MKLAMDRDLLERYSRNILLREIGGMGQKRLSQSKILVVGAGGLGAPILLYLTASGVGRIGLVDFDTVSLSNLQRQVLFREKDIGKLKVEAAESKLNSLNPNIEVVTYPHKLLKKNVRNIIKNYDLVLDGTDNFETRYLINGWCVKQKIPLLYGAISQWEGKVSLYDPRERSACFECLFPELNNHVVEKSCSENGVFGPLVGIIGTLMAAEAMKFITSAGSPLTNEVILYETLSGQMRRYKTSSRADCRVCGSS